MYVCVCMYIVCVYVYICIYVCVYVCMYVCSIYVCLYVSIYVCIYVYIYVYIYAYVYVVYMCIYMCMYVCSLLSLSHISLIHVQAMYARNLPLNYVPKLLNQSAAEFGLLYDQHPSLGDISFTECFNQLYHSLHRPSTAVKPTLTTPAVPSPTSPVQV